MDFYSNFINLCKYNKISPTTLLTRELNMSGSNLTKWKNGNIPKADTLNKLANYFNVSTDYLLGNEVTGDNITPPKLVPLITLAEDMTEEELSDVEEYAKFVKSKRKNDLNKKILKNSINLK